MYLVYFYFVIFIFKIKMYLCFNVKNILFYKNFHYLGLEEEFDLF